MKHSEFKFIPICTPKRGVAWFAPNALRHTARDSMNAFIDMCGPDEPDAWKNLKQEGWRIVKVKVST